jgi:hypothetical protein
MEDILSRFWLDLISRPSGPLAMRFYFQPIMAILLAVRAGIHDAKNGVSPFLWTVFTRPESRQEMLQSGWKDIARVFFLAVGFDVIFQLITFNWVFPGETLSIAFVLAILPYSLVRGPVNRFTKRKIQRNSIQSRAA